MDKRTIDVQAVIEKKQKSARAAFEDQERESAYRQARRAQRFDEQLAIIERSTAKEAEMLQAALSPNAPPYLIGDWLLMDSWSHEEGLLLLSGLQPAHEISVLRRAGKFSLEDKVHPSEVQRYLRTHEGLSLWRDYSDYLDDWETIKRRILFGVEDQLRFARRIWETGTHPERPAPSYFIKWAASKGIQIKWLQWASAEGFIESESVNPGDTDEQVSGAVSPSSLKKQVALLALVLAEKSGKYKKGDKPNANQIAEAVQELLDALPGAKTRGAGKSSIRDSIKAGIDLLTD